MKTCSIYIVLQLFLFSFSCSATDIKLAQRSQLHFDNATKQALRCKTTLSHVATPRVKRLLQFSIQRPHEPFPPFENHVGHFQVSLKNPNGKIIYSKAFSMEKLSPTQPTTLTIKIKNLSKGLYTFLITLLDRKNDKGIFDTATVMFPHPYCFNIRLLNSPSHVINIGSSTAAPLLAEIVSATDPSCTTELFFNL